MAKKKKAAKKPLAQNDFLHTLKQSKNPFVAAGKKSANPPQLRRFSRTK